MPDMRRIGRRALLAAMLAVVATSARAADDDAPRCRFSGIDHWPIRLVRGHLVVDGAINGRKIGIILDTGANSFILRAATERLELPRQEARGRRAYGVGGESKVDIAFMAEFAIGNATRKGWGVYSIGQHDFGEGIEFVLGEDFFRSVDVEFDLAHGAVRLFQAQDCERTWLGYWSKDVQRVEIERLHEASPRIIVPVTVNGKSLSAMLDSGAFASVLSLRDAAAVGLTPSTPGVKAIGQSYGLGAKGVEVWMGPLASFAIGDEKVTDIVIRFGDFFGDATYTATGSHLRTRVDTLQPMLLGADFLQSHRVLVSHSQRMLYFEYTGGPVFRPAGR
jgi:hypothetical protein